jgi:hypothetical protein
MMSAIAFRIATHLSELALELPAAAASMHSLNAVPWAAMSLQACSAVPTRLPAHAPLDASTAAAVIASKIFLIYVFPS